MKALKIALVVAGIFIGLLLLAVGIFSLPAVQRGLVVRAASGEGQELALEHFHAGPRKVEIRGLDFVQPGSRVQATEVTVDYSLMRLVFGKRLEIGEIAATGVLIELSDGEETGKVSSEGEQREVFEGILKQMKLPMPVSVGVIQVDGKVLLELEAGEEPLVAEFRVTGGKIVPGGTGQVHSTVDVGQSGQAGPIPGLRLEADLSVSQTEGGEIERAELLARLSGVAGGEERFPEMLNADIVLVATEGGEEYQAKISRSENAEGGTADLSTLLTLDAVYQRADGRISGRWQVEIGEEQLAAVIGETELPAFSANGAGNISVGLNGEIATDGELRLNVENLGPIVPQLQELGSFSLNAGFDLSKDETALRVSKLLVDLKQKEQTVLEVRNEQLIHFNLESGNLEGSDERFPLAKVLIRSLPIEWANLFIPKEPGEPEMVVSGGALTGQIDVLADEGSVFFRVSDPVQASGIGIRSGDEVLLDRVSILLAASGKIQDGEFEAAINPIDFARDDRSFLRGRANLVSDGPVEAEFTVNLPVLLSLPVLSDFNNLRSGLAEISLTASIDDPLEAEVSVVTENLVTATDQQRVADADIKINVRQERENVWAIDAPVRLLGAKVSDLNVKGSVEQGDAIRFDLSVTGDAVAVDQFVVLAAAFSNPDAVQKPEVKKPSGRDEVPVWDGVSGKLTLAIKEASYEADYRLENLAGEVLLAPEKADVSLKGFFLNEPVTILTKLDFLKSEAKPYRLQGSVDAPKLPLGEFFRQSQPNRPPTLDGIFAAAVEFSGTGENLESLIDGIQGKASLKSGGGIIRLLNTENPLANLGTAAGLILSQFSSEVATITNIANQLSNLSYNKIDIEAARDEKLNLVVQNFAVVAPEIFLEGKGKIEHLENVSLLNQPMDIRVEMGAQGAVGKALNQLRVLVPEPDNQGYFSLRNPFVITGTPGQPNSQAFYEMLAKTAIQFLGSGGEKRQGEEKEAEQPRVPQQLQEVLDIFDRLGGRRER